MRPDVHFEAAEIYRRLADLGLNEQHLLHAARRWHLAWASYTPNHPAVGIGIGAWTEAVAALREQLLPLGWTRSDERNYALVINPSGEIAVAVAAGDAATGRPDRFPSNKAAKGASTADAISVNQQQLELDLPVPDLSHIHSKDGPVTWVLLLYRASNELRSELSLPSQLSADGRIIQWEERVILPPVPLDEPISAALPQGADLDIDVKRKT